jgi:nicotinamide-nucleotide amidase
MKIKTAEILCVGTELLLGEVVNTNAAYIGRKLAELGISVYRTGVIGDNPQRLRREFLAAAERADLVIMSGGLGPTYDDLTKETVADSLGLEMVRDEKVLDSIRSYFAKTGRTMSQNNEKQADVPRGATAIENPYGTAPGIFIELDSLAVIMLPGPPRELIPMMEERVIPLLAAATDRTLVSKNVYIIGMGESEVESHLLPLMKEGSNPTVAPYAKEGEVRLRVSAMAENAQKGSELCDGAIEQIRASAVGKFIYGVDVDSMQNALFLRLRERGLTLATAESCTGGLIAKLITDLQGSSAVFAGGAVTYSNESKRLLADVSEETLAAHSAVSAEVAIEMARGIRKRLNADVGVSTTGSAGPAPDPSSDEPVGTVYIGVSTASEDKAIRLSLSDQRSRDYIRQVAASRAMREVFGAI